MAAARSFISATKLSIEPEIWTAMTLQTSLAELSIAQYRRSPRLIVSPSFTSSVEPSGLMPSSVSGPAVTASPREASPRSMASTASSTVISFVMEAG